MRSPFSRWYLLEELESHGAHYLQRQPNLSPVALTVLKKTCCLRSLFCDFSLQLQSEATQNHVHFHPVELHVVEGYCLSNDYDYLITISDMPATILGTKLRIGVQGIKFENKTFFFLSFLFHYILRRFLVERVSN